MTLFEKQFETEAQKLLEAFQNSYHEKGMVATGETVNSLRYEVYDDGFRIWGAEWIEQTEFGTPPGTKIEYQRLLAWANAVGYPAAMVAHLQWYLQVHGSRLWRGEDSRFPGAKQSGVLSDVVSDDYLENLKNNIRFAFIKNVYFVLEYD